MSEQEDAMASLNSYVMSDACALKMKDLGNGTIISNLRVVGFLEGSEVLSLLSNS